MVKPETKICTTCKKKQPVSNFHTYNSKRDGKVVSSRCKICERKRARGYWAKHPEQRRKNKLHFYYGISIEEYTSLLLQQKGVCAICGKPETRIMKGKVSDLVVDHNHTTGQNRGLLCHKCNLTLGTVDEDVSILDSAIRYLTFWNVS